MHYKRHNDNNKLVLTDNDCEGNILLANHNPVKHCTFRGQVLANLNNQ